MINKLLTPSEQLKLKELHQVIITLDDLPSLIILGVNTEKLAEKIKKDIFNKHSNIEYFKVKENTKYKNIIDTIWRQKKVKYQFINIFNHKQKEDIIKLLNYNRDYIFEKNLRLIFVFDNKSIKNIKQNAYDFFSRNNFFYNFTDHSYKFKQSDVKNSDELDEKIASYKSSSPKRDIAKLIDIGVKAIQTSKYDIALEYFDKSLNISKENSLLYEEAISLGNIGNVYQG